MDKKKLKKLHLKKTTIRVLTSAELRLAAGGGIINYVTGGPAPNYIGDPIPNYLGGGGDTGGGGDPLPSPNYL